MIFLDEAEIQVVAGRGGNGCLAFRREKFEPRGGPSGGDGGHGGSVFLVGETGRNTLYHLRGHRRYAADRGRHGEGSNKTGRSGQDLDVVVPLGTIAVDRESGDAVGEVLTEGDRLLVAEGGRGGRGNARFKTSTNRAPRRHEPGHVGDERWLRLELKLLADVGLVGLPNAGKSTLISAMSAARPKVAAYPFTTVVPNLGVVAGSHLDTPFTIADLPGLIEGAADGAGLGHQFLRHIDRCRVLAHLVVLGGDEDEDFDTRATEDLATIEDELRAFDPELLTRPRVIIGSKLDIVRTPRSDGLRAAAEDRGLPYLEVSAATHQNLRPLIASLRHMLDAADLESSNDLEPSNGRNDAP